MCVSVQNKQYTMTERKQVIVGHILSCYSMCVYLDSTLIEWAQEEGFSVRVKVGILATEVVCYGQKQLLLLGVLFVRGWALRQVHLLWSLWPGRIGLDSVLMGQHRNKCNIACELCSVAGQRQLKCIIK